MDTVLSQCLSGGTQEYKWVPVKGVLTCAGTESHPGGSSTHSYLTLSLIACLQLLHLQITTCWQEWFTKHPIFAQS